jgi:hypothetical protein
MLMKDTFLTILLGKCSAMYAISRSRFASVCCLPFYFILENKDHLKVNVLFLMGIPLLFDYFIRFIYLNSSSGNPYRHIV